MKRLLILFTLLILASCAKQSKPSYIVQVALGGWNAPEYRAAEIISRLDSVSALIPINTVIIGWSKDKDIYREVGSWLHGKGIKMFLWLPVFAETEEVCESTPAVDLWGREPANFDLTAGRGAVRDAQIGVDIVQDVSLNQAVLGLGNGDVVAHKQALAVIAFVAVAAGSKHCGRCCDG